MLKTVTLVLAAVAGFVLVSASDAKACCISVDLWVKVGVESTSPVVVTERLCIEATSQIIDQGYSFQSSSPLQPRLTALFFTKNGNGRGGDVATLFCAANVIEEILD